LSKQAIYIVELENVNETVLDRALEKMIEEMELEEVHKQLFKIFGEKKIKVNGTCIQLPGCSYPIDVYVDKEGKLVINGDEMDIKIAAGRIKQFYEAQQFSMRFRTPARYNKETDEIEMMLEKEVL